MNGLQAFDERLGALIGNLSPAARKEMARTIAKRLRAGQQQNIKRQQAPDGTPFKPRKAPARKKKGRVKREMFAKMRTAKYLKAKGSADDAVIEFTGNVQRMARVHHYGLRDRPARGGKDVQYDARPLMGISERDIHIINDIIMRYLE
ncbi:phage virion morphogenesis protein [Candidatus Erwinia dacicola]|uniref:Phage virion morphogenesis protein n=2 Tax=Candidatus Erwinia dacicola TaxID=252393 RepID=A0A328TQI5_9GAMM|nr:phage virion morphogenesis protein [Candidatus Erwinia dacicola]RAP72879.1 phage virion morphogenesis protein [Candidatus Erwinia dacicola]